MKRLLRALGWIALLIMLMGIGFELAEKFGGSPMLGGSAATAVWICLILWMTRDRTRAAVPPLPPVQESPLQVEEKQSEEAETEPIQKPRIRAKPLVVEVPSEVPAESDQNTEPEPTRNTAKTWMLTALGLIGFVALVMTLSPFEETDSQQEAGTLASSNPVAFSKRPSATFSRGNPVALPEGTWRPPSYSEQKMVQNQPAINMGFMEVSGVPGEGKWPLANISKGKIVCRGENDLLIFFQTPNGRLYGLNGLAREAAMMGRIGNGGIEDVLADRQRTSTPVTLVWLQAGVELCGGRGNDTKAQMLIDEANSMAKQSDSQTMLDITHPEIPRLAAYALSRSGYRDRPDLMVEVAQTMQEIRNACPGTHIEVIAGLLAGQYSRKPWDQIQTKAHVSVVEMNGIVSERIQAGPLCSREVDVTGLAMLVLSNANYPHNPNRESDQVLIESVESGIQRIQEVCPDYPENFIATALSELYQEGGLPTWRHYQSESDSDLMAANLAGLYLHLTLTSVIDELRNGGCE